MAGPAPRLRLLGYALALSAPVALAGGTMALLERVTPVSAAVIWLAGAAGAGLLLWRPMRSLSLLRQRLEGLAAAQPQTLSEWEALADDEIDLALRSAARRFAAVSDSRQRAQEYVRSLIDALPDPLLTVDRRRKVVQANTAATTLFGSAIVGRDVEAVIRNPAVLEMLDEVLSGHGGGRAEFSMPAPVERELVCHAMPTRDEQQERIVALVFNDISELRRTDKMRADFVANASHEIRTPLSTLAGCIETLGGPARDDPEAQTQFLEIMAQQAQRMTRLVEDLLSLSRIEMNEHTLPRGRVDVRLVLERVVEVVAAGDEEVRRSIAINAPDDLPPASGDENELEQVFQNLISNGLKYGGGAVTVTVDVADRLLPGAPQRAGALRVAVKDRGPGIPREHLPRLTERFYRVDAARSRQLGGTGLGLAIVKHIVSRHRGALTIESVVGQGSTFTVYLAAG